jgi:hypothetical protein
MADSFQVKLSQGKIGESLISRWLQSRGNMVFPAYQVEKDSGKGPQLFTAAGNFVLPDMMAFLQDGRFLWVEAKHKTCFTWHRKTGQWVTGVDLRHYKEYQKVTEKTNLPVWIVFWHPKSTPSQDDLKNGAPENCPTGLFGNDLASLAANENHRSDKWGADGMVYWAQNKLKHLALVEDVVQLMLKES